MKVVKLSLFLHPSQVTHFQITYERERSKRRVNTLVALVKDNHIYMMNYDQANNLSHIASPETVGLNGQSELHC